MPRIRDRDSIPLHREIVTFEWQYGVDKVALIRIATITTAMAVATGIPTAAGAVGVAQETSRNVHAGADNWYGARLRLDITSDF